MKKNLAFLLAAILLLTSMLGLTSAAETEAQAAIAPSQEIAYFNVSVKVGARLLFAVPADGYDVSSVDGSVANLKLLVWEEGESDGSYSRLDAEKNGTILESQGRQKIGDKYYVVFSYNGLSASEMSKSVYVRTLKTGDLGFRSYSQIYEYSIAEFANGYLNRASSANIGLVEAMMNYGHFAADYKGVSSYTAEEVKALKKVTVDYTLNGFAVGSDAQLVKAGEATTLEAPVVLEAKGVAPTWSVDGGVITTSENTTVTAAYESYTHVSKNFNTDGTTNMLGSYYSSAYEGNSTSKNEGKVAPPAGYTGTAKLDIGSLLIGNNLNMATPAHAFAYDKFLIAGDEDNQYVRCSHNGAGQMSYYDAFVSSTSATGVGDTMGFTFDVDLMSGKDGTFPASYFGIYGQGGTGGSKANGSPNLIKLNADGSVTLYGTVVEYNGIKTNVIAESISQTEFQKVSVYVDFAEERQYGYLDGELVAVTSFAGNYWTGTDFLAGYEKLQNTRFLVRLYCGYNAGNWANSKGALNADGLAAQAATVDLDGDGVAETKLYTVDEEGVGTWNPKAIEKYVDDNYYFYFDDIAIHYGAIYAK